jgi:flagellar protein FliJ
MKPFRLTTLERLRRQELETRAQELHNAAAAQERAVAERNQTIQLLAAGGTAAAPIGTWTGADLDLANNFRQVLRQQILDQDDQITALGVALGESRLAWLAARGRLRAVQALHDRHLVAVRAEQARLDQRELDEHAGARSRAVLRLSADTEAGIR